MGLDKLFYDHFSSVYNKNAVFWNKFMDTKIIFGIIAQKFQKVDFLSYNMLLFCMNGCLFEGLILKVKFKRIL